MNSKWTSRIGGFGAALWVAANSLFTLPGAAQPTLLSSFPPNNATGIAPNASVVFTFSEPMNSALTEAGFLDLFDVFADIPFSATWSVGNTVLTCTPTTTFPAPTTIYWSITGESAGAEILDPDPFGFFSTGSSTGSGTNATTTFSVGKVHHYLQTSAGAPTFDPLTPYGFSGVTSLKSNRTAVSVTLTNPVGGFFDLFHLPPPSAEIFILASNFISQTTFDATFPAGNYGFIVQTQALDQIVVVNLPSTASLAQPNAPHLTNYVAAQAINPNQPFVLGWDAFTGGATTNYIDVDVDGAINSPEPGQPGYLNGTARTFTIPAGTLLPNTTYAARIGFFRFVGTTNADYSTAAYRSTYTEFALMTTGGSTGTLLLTNATYSPANFSFDVISPASLAVTVEYKTNLNSAVWHTLLVTNNPPSRFRAVAPQSTTNRHLFFRARIGP